MVKRLFTFWNIASNESGFSLLELTTVIFIVIALSVIAIPKYIDLKEKINTNVCKTNQMTIESAVALAYADSLVKGSTRFPRRLLPEMFKDGKIPTCPEDGSNYRYNRKKQRAKCRAKNRRIRRRHNRRF